jgi:hypothetical protein
VDTESFQLIKAGDANTPVWSPKGDLIIYAGEQRGPRSPLLAVTPEGQPVPLLGYISVRVKGERFRFLPDGSGVVYMRGMGNSQDFCLLDLATGETRLLTELSDESFMLHFDITPDGTSIVFDRMKKNADLVLIERD